MDNSASVRQPSGSNKEFENLSLDEWINKFGRIYGKRHDRHTTEYMISRLVEEVAELVNPMESQNRDEIGPGLADVFSWTCSLAYKLGINLSELAWQKYGGKEAPHPAWASSGFRQPELASFSQPANLNEWQALISKVYQKENARLTPMIALLAMMKDVGDLAMLNRKREPLESVTSKLAAILAWSLTIAELLRLDLAELVYQKYDDHCPVCHQATCDTDVCHPLSNLFASFGEYVTDEEKYAILDAASKYGYKTMVNSSPMVQSTKDLALSLDLISKSDAACIILSLNQSPERSGSFQQKDIDYRQFFEVLASYSMLSRGNVWVFAREGSHDFGSYLEKSLASENIRLMIYKDAGNLRALFEDSLSSLTSKKAAIAK
jgi:NTP pyrophosphatase (non-canonical NTP hydrolase)